MKNKKENIIVKKTEEDEKWVYSVKMVYTVVGDKTYVEFIFD